MSLLRVENLRIAFPGPRGPLEVVRGVDLELEEGTTVALVGESGSGKSVTSLALMGLLSREARVEGRFTFQDRPFEPGSGKLRGHGMAMIFQNPMSSLNPVMKVGAQVAESLVYLRKFSRKESREASRALFAEVGLPHGDEFWGRYPHQLSGGMRQRVMIAVALACDPRLLIADEPTTALDVTIQAQILTLLKTLQEKRGMSLIMVTHDMSVVRSVAHRVCVMYAGQLVETGPAEQVLRYPSHPYTQALLRAIPTLEGERPERLETIPGRPPRPDELGRGCPFAPRCSLVEARCHTEVPRLVVLPQADRAARCLLKESGS